jgi:hypothetical protein
MNRNSLREYCYLESESLYDWLFTAHRFFLPTKALWDSRPVIFQLNTCGYSPHVTPFLMRRWVCRLQFLLALAIAVILKSESRRTHGHILLSQIRDSPNVGDHVPVFMSPRNRVTQLYPQALGSFSSPTKSRRAVVEVFEPASARDRIVLSKCILKVFVL